MDKTIFSIFIIVILVQLYVPAKMIIDKEDVLKTGKEFKFKTSPIDPNDPFRGKYITLNFNENRISTNNDYNWERGETIFVILKKDSDNFTTIKSVSKKRPGGNKDFVKAKVGYMGAWLNAKYLVVEYPFNRYYMEESKAYDAEVVYRKSRRDTSQITYALVNIKDGDAVLKDVMIDNISIKELVKRNNLD